VGETVQGEVTAEGAEGKGEVTQRRRGAESEPGQAQRLFSGQSVMSSRSPGDGEKVSIRPFFSPRRQGAEAQRVNHGNAGVSFQRTPS
jgi:hypothetical protein